MGLVLHVPTVPVVKIADQLHVDGVRRIDTELDAVLTVFVDRVRAENLICLALCPVKNSRICCSMFMVALPVMIQ